MAKNKLQLKLITAASEGNDKLIQICLDEGADINADVDGNYRILNAPIGIAIKARHDHTVIYLMNQVMLGPDSVALAIEYKNYKLAKLLLLALLEQKFPLNRISDEYMQEFILGPIQEIDDVFCTSIKNIINIERTLLREKIVKWLKEDEYSLTSEEEVLIKQEPYLLHESSSQFSKDIHNTPLLEAIIDDKTEVANKLVELDSEKKSLDMASSCYMANNTPLVLALKRGNCEVAKALIAAGANVDKQGFRGFTPLHWACILRLNDIVALLLSHGADPQIKNAFSKRPLDYYVSEISDDDLSFHLTYAYKLYKAVNEVDYVDIIYSDPDVVFGTAYGDSHKDRSKHCFATKVPDYSDMYWHIKAILQNLELEQSVKDDYSVTYNYAEAFNRRAIIFAEMRRRLPVNEEIVLQLQKNKEGISSTFVAQATAPGSGSRFGILAPSVRLESEGVHSIKTELLL